MTPQSTRLPTITVIFEAQMVNEEVTVESQCKSFHRRYHLLSRPDRIEEVAPRYHPMSGEKISSQIKEAPAGAPEV